MGGEEKESLKVVSQEGVLMFPSNENLPQAGLLALTQKWRRFQGLFDLGAHNGCGATARSPPPPLVLLSFVVGFYLKLTSYVNDTDADSSWGYLVLHSHLGAGKWPFIQQPVNKSLAPCSLLTA